MIAQLNSAQWVEDVTKLLRDAQQYTVNLYPQEFARLRRDKVIVEHLDGMIFEMKEHGYSEEYGVDMQGEGGLDFVGF